MNAKNRKPIKSEKSVQAANKLFQPIEPGATPEASQSNLARIHDLMGLAVISLPKKLREIIGDEAFELRIAELNQHEFIMIVREPHDVVYVRMPIHAMSSRPQDLRPKAARKASAPPEKKASSSSKSSKSRNSNKSAIKSATKPASRSVRSAGRGK
jgi:hypothetical protein